MQRTPKRTRKRTRPGTPVVGAWRRLSSRTVFKNQWFRIRHDRITIHSRPGTYDVLQTGGAIYVVPFDARGRTALVQQARYPTETYSWELPGGGLAGRTPLQAAKLELRQEAGLAARGWKKIGRTATINGISDEIMHIYLATNLRNVGTAEQADEDIRQVRWLSLRRALTWVKAGKITDAQTIAALSLAALHLGKLG